jgi:hypothetical protein
MKPLVCKCTLLVALVSLGGCGKETPAPADPGTGREALVQALKTWASGGSREDLEKQSPAIYFNEPTWAAGKRLVRYQIKGDVKAFGRQLQCTVSLSLQDRGGQTEQMDVPYQIDTHNVIVITRDFGTRR